MALHFIPFRPRLEGQFEERFNQKAQELAGIADDSANIEEVLLPEIRWAAEETRVNPLQRRRYRATWLLLRDLIEAGWAFRWKDGTLELARPDLSSNITGDESNKQIQKRKQRIRNVMKDNRLARIAEARNYIERVENPSPGAIAEVPISALIADGASLAKDLSDASKLQGEERLNNLRRLIQPYLQLVEENERCEHTGHKLSDIWRYFRFTWSTPAENTPGRTLLYLIRDAARPYHPVMGIFSLENAPLRITCRDYFLGWSPEAFRAELKGLEKDSADLRHQAEEAIQAGKKEKSAALEHEAETKQAEIYSKFEELLDLTWDAIGEINLAHLCRLDECRKPSRKLIHRLSHIAKRAAQERERALIAWEEHKKSGNGQIEGSDLGNISKEAEEALYRRKRALRLAQLLTARVRIQKLLNAEDFTNQWERFLENDDGKRAVWAALLALKNKHIGTSILELNVCGAIPPYNEILGGKLAALLAISPKVVFDYKKRYGKRPSEIASRMKGKKVIRPANLIYVGTTSLYTVGASQYNRLKLPAGFLRPGSPEIKWQRLKVKIEDEAPQDEDLAQGRTKGYGTLHISRVTLQALEEATHANDVLNVYHAFGEGPSPKLRIIRQALDSLFQPGHRSATDEMSRHEMSRLVYGAWIATNGPALFKGKASEPDYYFDSSKSADEQTGEIIDYWRSRWLSSRINYEKALEHTAGFDPEQLRVSRELIDAERLTFKPIKKTVSLMQPEPESHKWRDYVRKLYRSTSAYADNQDPQLLNQAHIETSLDSAIIEAVSKNKSVVLTGNPGDGKTHLLRLLAQQLREAQAVVELDASAISSDDLRKRWADSIHKGLPFCVAINEAVLKNLAETSPDSEELQSAQQQIEEAQRHVENAILYEKTEFSESDVVSFDLSRRNVLAHEIVNRVLDKLTEPALLDGLPEDIIAESDLKRNLDLLKESRVRYRLQEVLDRVSRRGYHATIRELQALISYLLFGGRELKEVIQSTGNLKTSLPQLLYNGEGRLFDEIRATFDPAIVTHPLWDELLVFAETKPEDWLPCWSTEASAIAFDSVEGNLDRFYARKRAFYLFHAKGNDLLPLAGDDESSFANLLTMPPLKALREMIRLLNGFFEDRSGATELRVWQSHRYAQSPRLILYSTTTCSSQDLKVVHPSLRPSMKQAFELAQNHLLLIHKQDSSARLRVDFPLFEVLQKAKRGIPVLTMENDITRRIWQFMEKLSLPSTQALEHRIVVLDATSGEKHEVVVDALDKRYLEIKKL